MKLLPVLIGIILLFNVHAPAQTTNTLSDAEIQGRTLAEKILAQRPSENFTNRGFLKIRPSTGSQTNIPITFEITVTETNWQLVYTANFEISSNGSDLQHHAEVATIIHTDNHKSYFSQRSERDYQGLITSEVQGGAVRWSSDESMPVFSFANSDFWIADLGLEFFHWPQQKVVKKEFYRQCSCTVLESTNPRPTPGSYSRVVSWIDNDSLGIVEAYAYDTNGKKLKDFYPKDFKKVDGQWQVQTLVMENLQTGSRSRLEFNLKK